MMEYFRRYRLPDAELSHWCHRPTWTAEEAIALSMGLDPASMSLESIGRLLLGRLHSSTGNRWLDEQVKLYLARHKQLMRGARFGDLPTTPSDEGYNIMPLDFLDWVMRQNLQKPWDALPAPLSVCVADRGPVITSPAGAKGLNTKGKAGRSSLGALKDKKGVAQTWDLLCSEMSKPINKRKFKTALALKAHCEYTFGIRHHDFESLRKKAIRTPGLTPWRRGRPRKAS